MVQISPELCEIIGAFIGDGYLHHSKGIYTLGIVGDSRLDKDYLARHMVSLLKISFPDANPRVYFRHDENTILLRVNSKHVYLLFLSLGFNPGPKSRTVKIPSQIEKDHQLMPLLVRGVFDTDRCVFFDRRKKYNLPYPRITLQTSSIPLLCQLEKFLSGMFNIYVNKDNRDGYRNYIEIYGHSQLETFLKEIGFSNKRHLDKIQAESLHCRGSGSNHMPP